MSPNETAMTETFEQKLSKLRMRIDRLPPAQQPHLLELANTISQQHRDLEEKKRVDHACH